MICCLWTKLSLWPILHANACLCCTDIPKQLICCSWEHAGRSMPACEGRGRAAPGELADDGSSLTLSPTGDSGPRAAGGECPHPRRNGRTLRRPHASIARNRPHPSRLSADIRSCRGWLQVLFSELDCLLNAHTSEWSALGAGEQGVRRPHWRVFLRTSLPDAWLIVHAQCLY